MNKCQLKRTGVGLVVFALAIGCASAAESPSISSGAQSARSAFLKQFEGLWEQGGGVLAFAVVGNVLVALPVAAAGYVLVLEPIDEVDRANQSIMVHASVKVLNKHQECQTSLEKLVLQVDDNAGWMGEAKKFSSFSEAEPEDWLAWFGSRGYERLDTIGNKVNHVARKIAEQLQMNAEQYRRAVAECRPDKPKVYTLRNMDRSANTVQPVLISDSGSVHTNSFIRRLTDSDRVSVEQAMAEIAVDEANTGLALASEKVSERAQSFDATAERVVQRGEELTVWWQEYIRTCLAEGKFTGFDKNRFGPTTLDSTHAIREVVATCQMKPTIDQIQQWMSDINDIVMRNWDKPPSGRPGLECEVRVSLNRGMEVVNVEILQCNGDKAVKRSIIAAVKRASPLPSPVNEGIFESPIVFLFKY